MQGSESIFCAAIIDAITKETLQKHVANHFALQMHTRYAKTR